MKKAFIFFAEIFVLIIIIAAISNGGGGQPASSGSGSNIGAITKDNYDKIQTDMTKADVEKILGKPTSVSESETPGLGKMELPHYQKGFEMEAIDVTYLNGKVYTKNWTDL